MSTCRQLFKEHFDTKHEWLLSVFIFYPACFQHTVVLQASGTIARRSSILKCRLVDECSTLYFTLFEPVYVEFNQMDKSE